MPTFYLCLLSLCFWAGLVQRQETLFAYSLHSWQPTNRCCFGRRSCVTAMVPTKVSFLRCSTVLLSSNNNNNRQDPGATTNNKDNSNTNPSPAVPGGLPVDSSITATKPRSTPTQVKRERLLEQKKDVQDVLRQVEELQAEATASGGSNNTSSSGQQLLELANKVDVHWEQQDLVPPPGVSHESFERRIAWFWNLPVSVRMTIIKALDLEPTLLTEYNKYPSIVEKLYESGDKINEEQWERARGSVKESISQKVRLSGMSAPTSANGKSPDWITTDEADLMKAYSEADLDSMIRAFSLGTTLPETWSYRANNDDKTLFVSKEELNTFLKACDDPSSRFLRTEDPIDIGYGYVIVGKNIPGKKRQSASNKDSNVTALLASVDKLLPETGFDVTSSWIRYDLNKYKKTQGLVDFLMSLWDGLDSNSTEEMPWTDELDLESFEELKNSRAFLLLKKSIPPRPLSKWVKAFSTLAAFASTVFFGVSIYAGNDAVVQRIGDVSAANIQGAEFLNSIIFEALWPLAVIQGIHELGHVLVALTSGLKVTPPTFLPFLTLPFAGSKVLLKESPKNYNQLFDFAFVGPTFGMVAALIFLVTGCQETLLATPEASQYFPVVPVNLLQSTNLGSAIVDEFFGGAGMLSQQVGNEVKLHPHAVAGLVGLIIQAIQLFPAGDTDGGRICLAMFGRDFYSSVVSRAFWLSLLGATLFLDGGLNFNFILLLFIFTEGDISIPCRDEITPLDGARYWLGVGLLAITAITLIPSML